MGLPFPDQFSALCLADRDELDDIAFGKGWLIRRRVRQLIKVSLNEIEGLRNRAAEYWRIKAQHEQLEKQFETTDANNDRLLEKCNTLSEQLAEAQSRAMAESSRADAMMRARDNLRDELDIARVKLEGIEKILKAPTSEAL